MPKRKPYLPYQNIRRHSSKRRQASVAVQPYVMQKPHNHSRSEANDGKFALGIILGIIALIIGGAIYMSRQTISDGELLKSLVH